MMSKCPNLKVVLTAIVTNGTVVITHGQKPVLAPVSQVELDSMNSRQRRAAQGLCKYGKDHGPAVAGGRCQACREKKNAGYHRPVGKTSQTPMPAALRQAA